MFGPERATRAAPPDAQQRLDRCLAEIAAMKDRAGALALIEYGIEKLDRLALGLRRP